MGKLPKHFLEVSSINFRNSGVNRFKLVILQCFLSPLSIYAMIDQLSNEDHFLVNGSQVFPLCAQKKMRATRAEERSRWKGLHLLIFSALSQWLCSNAMRIIEATCSRPQRCDVALFESFRDVADSASVMSVWSTSRSILRRTYTYVHLFTSKSHQIQYIVVYECT